MAVEDDAKAAEYLQRIGYYRLSAYWHPMRARDQRTGAVLDTFVEGTTFKEVTDLYTFDGRLRLIMLDALERIEVSLRTEVALTLGAKAPRAHREAQYLSRNFAKARNKGRPSKHREWLQQLDDRFLASKDKFAEHFRNQYPGDDMPVWIAVELLDFGPLSHLIAGMTYKDRETIGQNYGGIEANVLPSWARSLAFTRNVCAHHSRLWNKPLVNQPSLEPQKSPVPLRHVPGAPGSNTRFYAIACIAQHMISFANPRTSWRRRFLNHLATFPSSPRLRLRAAGFPDEWRQEELWCRPT
jgi:abortive infection bacteriophage resistance protein